MIRPNPQQRITLPLEPLGAIRLRDPQRPEAPPSPARVSCLSMNEEVIEALSKHCGGGGKTT